MKWRGEEGIALVITLLVMTILLIMGTAFMSISSTETLIAINERNRLQAYHLAEAAADLAIARLNVNAGFTGSGVQSLLPIGTYDVTVTTPVTNPDQRIIAAMGCVRNCTTIGNSVARVTMEVERTSPFQFGLFGLNVIKLQSLGTGVVVDSYDSSLGPYDPANSGFEGHIHSNGNIEVEANSTVKGNAAAGGTITVGAGSTITGTTTAGVSSIAVVTNITYPSCGGYVTGVNPPAAYDGASCNLTVGNNQTVTLDPGTYAFNRVDVGSNGKLAMNGPVTIYMTDQFKAQSGAVINTSKIPGNLMIFSLYDGTDGNGTDAMMMASGSGEFYAGIYALDGEVEFNNGGWQIFGAIVAKEIDIENGSLFHFDKAITQASNPAGKFRPLAGSWREVIQ